MAVLLITGPTAVGKTEAAVRIAGMLGGEVISADSRQIYRHFDIGTAKPEPHITGRIPHHLIDIRDPGEDYSAGDFARDAVALVRSLEQRGKVPIVCGGATLYLRALTKGFFKQPVDTSAMKRARKDLLYEAGSRGIGVLHQRLLRVDPCLGRSLAPGDTQRIIRALEVYHATGVPLSEWHRKGIEKPDLEIVSVCLFLPREELARRIETRTREMLRRGLVEEVKRLRAMRIDETSGPFTSVGYREILAYLEGSMSLEDAQRLINTNTRRYAKRQLTWFRGMKELTWIQNGEAAVGAICEAWKRGIHTEN